MTDDDPLARELQRHLTMKAKDPLRRAVAEHMGTPEPSDSEAIALNSEALESRLLAALGKTPAESDTIRSALGGSANLFN